ncbi:hypothetical protein [Burkholderia multivorans]|uniref:hypothetical protein n=1 Tax=Burkholderia multivorans TaxID=87883 RepID=UPI0021C1EDD7|nr:hypothetical protein [Burkholderia multivorans]
MSACWGAVAQIFLPRSRVMADAEHLARASTVPFIESIRHAARLQLLLHLVGEQGVQVR